ncbi:Serine/arginine-rich splicing factor 12 [Toxocara canis]|uniref:Serine/arginine-rich splicing factor 12 n=1 Tax=Toxocara canis TaxID=6265 RepID=A0A0B2UVY4_TOXCA|nr:Serine/arginine-rich splicing factor 12 [Toxocara canis]
MSRRRHSTYRADEDATLYVRQVHYAARPDDLRVVFERMGPVRDVYIPLDYYTRESRGFAYVKYEDAGDAERAFRQLHGCAVLGRRICIEWAEGERKTKSEMREKEERAYGRYKRERRVSRSPPRRRFRERSSSSESRSKELLSRKSSSARRGETIRRNSLELERGVFDELEERSEDGDSDQQEVGNHTEIVVSRAIKPVRGKKSGTYLKLKGDHLEVAIEHKEKKQEQRTMKRLLQCYCE